MGCERVSLENISLEFLRGDNLSSCFTFHFPFFHGFLDDIYNIVGYLYILLNSIIKVFCIISYLSFCRLTISWGYFSLCFGCADIYIVYHSFSWFPNCFFSLLTEIFCVFQASKRFIFYMYGQDFPPQHVTSLLLRMMVTFLAIFWIRVVFLFLICLVLFTSFLAFTQLLSQSIMNRRKF